MNDVPKMFSLITLGFVILPCLLYFCSLVGFDAVKWTAVVGTIGWFIAMPMWMSRPLPN